MRSSLALALTLALTLTAFIVWIYKRGGPLECYKKVVCEDTPVVSKDRQILVEAVKTRKALTPSTYRQQIPKVIIQTNERSKIPEGMYQSTDSILRANPEYDYIYFDNKDARDYISNNYPANVVAAYDKLIPGAYKADLFRYCILYKIGGVYIDTGMVARGHLRDIIRPDDVFVSPEDDGTAGVYNAFIACVPGNPIIKAAIDMCVRNIENDEYRSNPLEITGPGLLAEALKSIVGTRGRGDYRVPQPNEVYAPGVRIIRYTRTGFCTTEGNIYDGDVLVLTTRYPTYHVDRNWYNTNKHYSELWRARKVFKTQGQISLENHQRSLLDLLKRFINVANKEKLRWWATGGTLLGAVREGKIIEWDDDIDIEAPSETIEKLKTSKELEKEGLRLTFSDHIWRIKYLNDKDEGTPYIDVFEVERKFSGSRNSDQMDAQRDIQRDILWGYVDKVCTERWPNSFFYESELFPLTELKFGENLTIKAPKSPEFYLERQYGDWRTPVKEKGHYNF